MTREGSTHDLDTGPGGQLAALAELLMSRCKAAMYSSYLVPVAGEWYRVEWETRLRTAAP
jgi:hypothetical protein